MMRITAFVLSLLVTLLLVETPHVSAFTYYVSDADGNDYDDGQSLSGAWKTLAKANQTVLAGDTVYVRGGTYDFQTISPLTSGSSGNYITYQNYATETVTILGGNKQVNLDNKNYINVNGFTLKNSRRWVNIDNGNHNVVQNNVFDGGDTGGWVGVKVEGTSRFNKLLNNTFEDAVVGPTGQYSMPEDFIDFKDSSESNLLEGNTFGNSSHIPISINGPGVTRNVIRNNTISNRWHTGSDCYPDGPRNMWEGNRFYDVGEDFEENPRHETDYRERWELPGLELGANSNIVRENVFANTGCGLYLEDWYAGRTTNLNRVYSNTFDANYRSIRNMDTPQDVSFNVIKNNSITNSIEYDIWFNDMAGDNSFENNNIHGGPWNKFRSMAHYNILSIQNAYPSQWSGTLSVEPEYVDAAGRDFHLQASSPLIDAGTWLTTITSSTGSGISSFTVEDAGYFYDGWDIPGELGDLLKTESGEVTSIASVDYATNTLIVSPAINILLGEGLALYYAGSSPDIGAFEYSVTITGDFDGDGDVDGSDFLMWQRNPGQYDLAEWEAGFGNSSSVVLSANVPEPSTMPLVVLGIFTIVWRNAWMSR